MKYWPKLKNEILTDAKKWDIDRCLKMRYWQMLKNEILTDAKKWDIDRS